MATGSERPVFTGASVYNDSSRLLSFWYASEWRIQRARGRLPSITITPDPADPATHIDIVVKDIRAPLSAKDRPAILEGIREGLANLDSHVLESLIELDENGRWGVEWQCTFVVDGLRRRRRARLFFSDRYQYSVVLDGSSEERYSYWQGMFEFTLLTVGTAPFSLGQWAKSADPHGHGPA